MKMLDWAKGHCILETKYLPERQCLLEWAAYLDGSPALLVMGANGERLFTATVWQDRYEITADHILVKDYSENEGIFAALVELGVVGKTVMGIKLGHAIGLICPITDKAKTLPGWAQHHGAK